MVLPFEDAYLAAIIASSDDAIVSKDLEGTITSWNGAAERMFGYTAEEAVGKSITMLVPTDRLDEETYVLSRIRNGESVEHYETIRRRKDGTLIPISLTVSPIRNAAGRVLGASKIARDITERREAEASLARAEQGQRDLQRRLITLVGASGKLFESSALDDVQSRVLELAGTVVPADGYAVWRLDGQRWRIGASSGVTRTFVDQIIETYRGEAVKTVPFQDPLLVADVCAVPMLADRVEAYRAEGIKSIMAVPLMLSGVASATMVYYYRQPHTFDEVEVQTGRALGNLAAAAIATAKLSDQQRRHRQQVERVNHRAVFLAEVSAALAGSLDYEATLRTVARLAVPHVADWCAVDMLGERGEIQRLAVAHVDPSKVELARRLQEQYPDDPDVARGAAAVIRSGQPIMIEEISPEMIRTASKDPEHLRILEELSIRSYICVPLVVQGRTLGALTFVSTESGRLYTKADFQLAQDIAYRSALAVENARVYEQAAAANRAKDEFLATLSHELRTPLNAMLGWMRMLRGGTLTPAKMSHALEVVERNASTQLRLVEDLLDLSRIITGKYRLDVQPIHLSIAVAAAVEGIQPAATAKDITLIVDTNDNADLVLGDTPRLQQAVWNLLSNAIKFTPRDGRVAVSVYRAGPHVDVEVSDTGEGIAPEVLPYVFDRFRQGDSGTTRTHMGLGLGLAIVRHIVELHGGSVAVTSPGRGHGATFRLSLPAAMAGHTASISRQPLPVPQATETSAVNPLLDGLRALIVDDDPDARDLLRELLEPRGVRVISAGSVAEALAVFEREAPDIVISDIAMPGEDGFDLIRRLRERPPESGGGVPAVALSAYARPEDGTRSITSGFQVHLSKPVDGATLEATVVRLTGKSLSS